MLNVSIKDHTEIILFSIVVKIVALQRLGVPACVALVPSTSTTAFARMKITSAVQSIQVLEM